MKRTFALLTLLLVFAIFDMQTHAGPPQGPYVMPVEVVNEPIVHVGSIAVKEVIDVLYELALYEGGNPESRTIYAQPDKIFILTDIDLRCIDGLQDVSFQLEAVNSSGSRTTKYKFGNIGPVTHENLQLTSGFKFSSDDAAVFTLSNTGAFEHYDVQLFISGYLVDE